MWNCLLIYTIWPLEPRIPYIVSSLFLYLGGGPWLFAAVYFKLLGEKHSDGRKLPSAFSLFSDYMIKEGQCGSDTYIYRLQCGVFWLYFEYLYSLPHVAINTSPRNPMECQFLGFYAWTAFSRQRDPKWNNCLKETNWLMWASILANESLALPSQKTIKQPSLKTKRSPNRQLYPLFKGLSMPSSSHSTVT